MRKTLISLLLLLAPAAPADTVTTFDFGGSGASQQGFGSFGGMFQVDEDTGMILPENVALNSAYGSFTTLLGWGISPQGPSAPANAFISIGNAAMTSYGSFSFFIGSSYPSLIGFESGPIDNGGIYVNGVPTFQFISGNVNAVSTTPEPSFFWPLAGLALCTVVGGKVYRCREPRPRGDNRDGY